MQDVSAVAEGQAFQQLVHEGLQEEEEEEGGEGEGASEGRMSSEAQASARGCTTQEFPATGCPSLPSQSLGPGPHCSCQSISSGPRKSQDKRAVRIGRSQTGRQRVCTPPPPPLQSSLLASRPPRSTAEFKHLDVGWGYQEGGTRRWL